MNGPWRRRKVWVDAPQFVVSKAPKIDWLNPDPTALVPAFEQVVYHVHRIEVGGMTFAVATTSAFPPPREKVLKAIFTSAGLAARIQ
jgi:hypothetical protein